MAQVFPVKSMIAELFKDVFYRTQPQSTWSEEAKAIAPSTYTWTQESCVMKDRCGDEVVETEYKIGNSVMLDRKFEDHAKAAITLSMKPHLMPDTKYKIADFLVQESELKDGLVMLARLTNGKIVNVSRLRLA